MCSTPPAPTPTPLRNWCCWHVAGRPQYLSGLGLRPQAAGTDAELSKQVESGKKQFVGIELPNRTLGVIGLGAIGVKVANAARALGMRVIGYDPHITVSNAWQLSSQVETGPERQRDGGAGPISSPCTCPLNDATRQLINAPLLKNAKAGLILLNFSREGVVDEEAIYDALQAGKLKSYVCDFPDQPAEGSSARHHAAASGRFHCRGRG